MLLFTALALSLAAPQDPPANPQIDYAGFATLTRDVRALRAKRLLAFDKFQAMAAGKDVLLLDARSKDAFARGHIAGAVNLPFTDFTAEALAAVVGPNRDRPILIYCNNNFSNHRSPVPLKNPQLALNIQTFINLVGYGYANVWELRDVVDFNDPKVGWVTTAG
ncbi:rhodanese-like domain-containing protein [Sphingomonas sp. HITSZ_GF]|uniref:rhodanese-like domain-containing protein n=1 Tax=Sphingomonas sp. HITSZ_GF TaxID=3037247 RepID=UPI00240E9166|nr:rhodanese-like domain-containing protein [Sphingomonas sp. HITSZ_GF]MDG2535301.1 rhodanese-like domain-containing protein [Sphingomonas sp. HITSZ_GF]